MSKKQRRTPVIERVSTGTRLERCRVFGCGFHVERPDSAPSIIHHLSPEGHDHMAPVGIAWPDVGIWVQEVHEMMGWP